MTTFHKLKLPGVKHPIAVNADEIRAVMRKPDGSGFLVWLKSDLGIKHEVAERVVQLAGLTPMVKDVWDCTSEDLELLLPK